jgi:hypothetical protein
VLAVYALGRHASLAPPSALNPRRVDAIVSAEVLVRDGRVYV